MIITKKPPEHIAREPQTTAEPDIAHRNSVASEQAFNGAPGDSILDARQLRIGYGEKTVVEDISLGLERGTVTALVGPNGSGKSTVLRSLARLLKPQGGAVYLDGKAIDRISTKEVAKRIGVLPQSPDVPQGTTVWDLVAFGRYPHQGLLSSLSSKDRDAMESALELTGLIEMRGRIVDTLSGGERQRAWVAMALAQQTDLLLLDEPTTYLDIRYQIDVLSLVRRLNREHGITVGWALHDLNHAACYSDRVFVIRDGAVVANGPPFEVIRPDIIADVFKVEVSIIPHPKTGAPVCLPDEYATGLPPMNPPRCDDNTDQ